MDTQTLASMIETERRAEAKKFGWRTEEVNVKYHRIVDPSGVTKSKELSLRPEDLWREVDWRSVTKFRHEMLRECSAGIKEIIQKYHDIHKIAKVGSAFRGLQTLTLKCDVLSDEQEAKFFRRLGNQYLKQGDQYRGCAALNLNHFLAPARRARFLLYNFMRGTPYSRVEVDYEGKCKDPRFLRTMMLLLNFCRTWYGIDEAEIFVWMFGHRAHAQLDAFPEWVVAPSARDIGFSQIRSLMKGSKSGQDR